MGFINPIDSILKSTVMKKTIHINVSGQLFHVDEDAFEKLSGYLINQFAFPHPYLH